MAHQDGPHRPWEASTSALRRPWQSSSQQQALPANPPQASTQAAAAAPLPPPPPGLNQPILPVGATGSEHPLSRYQQQQQQLLPIYQPTPALATPGIQLAAPTMPQIGGASVYTPGSLQQQSFAVLYPLRAPPFAPLSPAVPGFNVPHGVYPHLPANLLLNQQQQQPIHASASFPGVNPQVYAAAFKPNLALDRRHRRLLRELDQLARRLPVAGSDAVLALTHGYSQHVQVLERHRTAAIANTQHDALAVNEYYDEQRICLLERTQSHVDAYRGYINTDKENEHSSSKSKGKGKGPLSPNAAADHKQTDDGSSGSDGQKIGVKSRAPGEKDDKVNTSNDSNSTCLEEAVNNAAAKLAPKVEASEQDDQNKDETGALDLRQRNQRDDVVLPAGDNSNDDEDRGDGANMRQNADSTASGDGGNPAAAAADDNIDEHVVKKRGGRVERFPRRTHEVLEAWYQAHLANAYVDPEEAEELAKRAGVSVKQVRKWLSNRRNEDKNTRTGGYKNPPRRGGGGGSSGGGGGGFFGAFQQPRFTPY